MQPSGIRTDFPSAIEAINNARTAEDRYEALRRAIRMLETAGAVDIDPGQRNANLAHLHAELGRLLSSGRLDVSDPQLQAAQAFGRAARLFRELGMAVESAHADAAVASSLLQTPSTAERDRALFQAYDRALTVLTEKDHPAAWAWIQGNLITANCDRVTGDKRANVERAIAHAHASLRVRTREADRANWAFVHANLAYAYLQRIEGDRLDNMARAIESAEAALEVYTREDHPSGWAQAHMNLASAYLVHAGQENYREVALAIESMEKALSVYTPESAPYDAIQLYVMLSEALLLMSDEDGEQSARRGLRVADQALSMLDGSAPCEELGRVLNVRGQLARRSSPPDIAVAIESFTDAMKGWSADRRPYEWAQLQHQLGLTYLVSAGSGAVEDAKHALRAFDQALTVITRSSHPTEWALIKADAGDAHIVSGSRRRGSDIDNAIHTYEEALQALHPQKDAHAWGTIQCKLGEAYVNRSFGNRVSNVALAVEALEHAVVALEQAGDRRACALAHVSLSGAYLRDHRDRGNFDRALGAARFAGSVITPRSDPYAWGLLQSTLSAVYAEQISPQSLQQAIDCAAEALQALDPRRDVQLWLQIQQRLALAHHRLGSWFGMEWVEPGKPRPHLERAREAYLKALAACPPEGLQWERLLILARLAEVLADLSDWPALVRMSDDASATAASLFAQGLSEEEIRAAIGEWSRSNALGALGAAQLKDAEGAWDRVERTRAHLLSMAIDTDEAGLPPPEQQRLSQLRAQLGQLAREAAPGPDSRNRRQAIRSEIAHLRQRTTGSRPDDDAGLNLLTMVVTAAGGAILLRVGESNVISLVPRQSREVFSALMYSSLNTSEESKWVWAGRGAEEIATKLAANLWSVIADAGIPDGSRITWIPPHQLAHIPLASARDPQSGRQIVDSYELVQAPSRLMAVASARRAREIGAGRRDTAGVFDPVGDLPYAHHERDLIRLSAPGGVPLHVIEPGNDSSKVLREMSSCGIWHFATHGWFDWADFWLSGIELGRDREGRSHALTVDDLLYRTPRIAPRLVVLTVCESALNDIKESPNEMLGLPSAFLAAGAAGVIATSWPVDDLATAMLVARIYHGHFALDLSPPAALRAGQRWLRDATPEQMLAFLRELQANATTPSDGHELRELQLALQEMEGNEKVFADARYWGGFVYVGA